MKLCSLSAISPVDGRYWNKSQVLSEYFSEYALIKYRVLVEIEYFISLCELPLPQLKEAEGTDLFNALRKIYHDFSLEDAEKIKEIERTTNHDVKAIEYFIKEKLEELNAVQYKEFIHFGLTSQDINNTAIPLLLKTATEKEYLPLLRSVINKLLSLSKKWEQIPMLARTHGQPASPTRLGKEIMVFAYRLEVQIELMQKIPHSAKFGGAIGNFNAHRAAYPQIDWKSFADHFIKDKFNLEREEWTTQISNYDNLSALLDSFKRINIILIDMVRDFWMYISMKYFKQMMIENETGSSVMPHKINPIDFENAEGNLSLAHALFEFFAAKLPISRLQRDLTDSTTLRNIGVPIAHSMIAFQSILHGLDKLDVNESVINQELNETWAVVAEGIQTVLRREGFPQPYEAMKKLTRTNEPVTEKMIHDFIHHLPISEDVKQELLSITPQNYSGIF